MVYKQHSFSSEYAVSPTFSAVKDNGLPLSLDILKFGFEVS